MLLPYGERIKPVCFQRAISRGHYSEDQGKVQYGILKLMSFSLLSIIVPYVRWHYYDQPSAFLKAWRNFVLFGIEFFSVRTLLRTFFSPWKQMYSVRKTLGFDIGDILKTGIENILVSMIGAVLRSWVLLLAICYEILIIIIGLILILFWFLLPFIIMWGLISPFF